MLKTSGHFKAFHPKGRGQRQELRKAPAKGGMEMDMGQPSLRDGDLTSSYTWADWKAWAMC